MMRGPTDISHIGEYGWFDWVMFRDNLPTFPDNKMILGRYLGPATNIGNAMTAKILKANGPFVCRSTLRQLTQEELDSPVHQEAQRKFNESIDASLGPGSTDEDFDAEDLMPELPHMEDQETDNSDDQPPDEMMPEAGDNYINAKISIPKGGSLARGRVIGQNGTLTAIQQGEQMPTQYWILAFTT